MAQIVTVAGVAQVLWTPNYTLTLTSPDGISLDADGKSHPLKATLLNTATSAPIPGKPILLETLPLLRDGDRSMQFTNGRGVATFSVSDSSEEVVDYTGFLSPQQSVFSPTLAITWGTSPPPPPPPLPFPPVPPIPPSPPAPPSPPGLPEETEVSGVSDSPGGDLPLNTPVVITIEGVRNFAPTPNFFPLVSGSSVQLKTDPPGGPGDGQNVSFVDFDNGGGAFVSLAKATVTSAVPGEWKYYPSGPTTPWVVTPAPNPAVVPGSSAFFTVSWG